MNGYENQAGYIGVWNGSYFVGWIPEKNTVDKDQFGATWWIPEKRDQERNNTIINCQRHA